MGVLMMAGMGRIRPFLTLARGYEEVIQNLMIQDDPAAETMRDGYYLLDADGQLVDADATFCSTVGYAREELLRMHISQIEAGTADPAEAVQRVEEIMAKGQERCQIRYRRKDGEEIDVEVRAHLVRAGGQQYLSAMVCDLAQLRRAREELSRNLFDAAPDGYCVADRDGVIRDINATLLQWFGYERDQIVGFVRMEDLVASGAREPLIRLLTRGDRMVQQETVDFLRKDGSILPAWLHLVTLYAPDGSREGFRATIRDISREKKLEAQLLQAQKLESLGALVGGIAHDFNNMLTGILGHTQLLLQSVEPEGTLYDSLRRLEKLSERSAKIVRQLLAFSRKDASQKVTVSLHPFVKELGLFLERIIPENIQIELNLAQDALTLEADPTQLQQVLMNLAINARDAMPGGGRLGIHTATVHADERFCEVHPGMKPGRYVRLSITDTGLGMPPEVSRRIFDPFFTTKAAGKGTGLGLAIVHAIVSDHGGTVEVESEVGLGTVIRLYLPLSEKEVAEPQTPNVEDLRGSEMILLVEDDSTVVELAQAVLEHFGYRVLTARDGIGALAIYEVHGEKISLVLLDLILPRLGGLETLRELRRLNPVVRVLLTTGYGSTLDVPTSDQISTEGCGLLQKPYAIHELAHAVRAALDRDDPLAGPCTDR